MREQFDALVELWRDSPKTAVWQRKMEGIVDILGDGEDKSDIRFPYMTINGLMDSWKRTTLDLKPVNDT